MWKLVTLKIIKCISLFTKFGKQFMELWDGQNHLRRLLCAISGVAVVAVCKWCYQLLKYTGQSQTDVNEQVLSQLT